MSETNEPRVGAIITGLPGAGKTEAAEIAQRRWGGTVIGSGQLVRNEFERQNGREPNSSEELGEFAAAIREDEGQAVIGWILTRYVRDREPNVEYPLWVDGARNIEGVRSIQEFMTTTQVLWVDAGREVRLRRIRERGRDNEADFTMAELLQRDGRELSELGLSSIINTDVVDDIIPNTSTLDYLEAALEHELWPAIRNANMPEMS